MLFFLAWIVTVWTAPKLPTLPWHEPRKAMSANARIASLFLGLWFRPCMFLIIALPVPEGKKKATVEATFFGFAKTS